MLVRSIDRDRADFYLPSRSVTMSHSVVETNMPPIIISTMKSAGLYAYDICIKVREGSDGSKRRGGLEVDGEVGGEEVDPCMSESLLFFVCIWRASVLVIFFSFGAVVYETLVVVSLLCSYRLISLLPYLFGTVTHVFDLIE